MRKLIETRPSVATVLSLIALFAALGGTSYAAATITGKQVKNGSLTGLDVKNRSLTGKDVKTNSLAGGQINESKLGQVPSSAKSLQADNATQAQKATTADSATTATNATNAANANSADTVKDNSINGDKVADRSLSAVDVAVANGSPTVNLPSIPANDCNYVLVSAGTNLTGATVSVSARDSALYSTGGLSLHAAKSNVQTSFRLVACNMTAAAIDPPAAAFDYTAIR